MTPCGLWPTVDFGQVSGLEDAVTENPFKFHRKLGQFKHGYLCGYYFLQYA